MPHNTLVIFGYDLARGNTIPERAALDQSGALCPVCLGKGMYCYGLPGTKKPGTDRSTE